MSISEGRASSGDGTSWESERHQLYDLWWQLDFRAAKMGLVLFWLLSVKIGVESQDPSLWLEHRGSGFGRDELMGFSMIFGASNLVPGLW